MRLPSPAIGISLVALFVALGGTTWAAVNLPRNSVGTRQLRNGAVTGPKLALNAVTAPKVAPDALTGAQIDESTLGTVPDASKLGGAAASSYRDGCPAGLQQAPLTDLCFETTKRDGTWNDAAKACALARLRLPTPGELAQVYDASDAQQTQEWTSDVFFFSGVPPSWDAIDVKQNTQRELEVNGAPLTETEFYRCVTTVRN